jgi:lipopolysaccharide/colanic/teichoic acid biosynthesis glycosyltransferase
MPSAEVAVAHDVADFGGGVVAGSGSTAWPALSRSKRALDVVLAVASVVVLLPVLLMTAVVLKVSGSDVIYRAPRIGLGGRAFTMFKFCTMRDDAGPRVTVEGDPRITRIGRWLRASKLNELPQIINVIKGDMSLVGPRPEDPRYTAHYSPQQRQVLAVRPGLTSLAFLRFGNEEAFIKRAQPVDVEAYYLTELLPEKLNIELAYIRNWSMRDDFRIIASTARRLLS